MNMGSRRAVKVIFEHLIKTAFETVIGLSICSVDDMILHVNQAVYSSCTMYPF